MMKRVIAMFFAFGLIVTSALPALASIDVYKFNSAKEEKTFQDLTATLRCPKCQNNTIADSNATLAQDMRKKVFEMLDEGKSKQEIIDYMIARYGNFVTYDPPLMASTLVLWMGPFLFILVGFTVLVVRSRKTEDAKSKIKLAADEEVRLKELLNEMEQQEKAEQHPQNKNGKVKS